MAKLTYANKVALNQNISIPDENKITDTNMNDIKKAINQSTNYNATIEDGTGKIKCTLTGTLASGDIVNVTIPTLANTSATMQLSIDGGTTYYYIKQMSDDAVFNDYSNTEISASKCTLYFDGTQFILDKSKFGGKVINNLNTIVRNGKYTALGTATGVPNSSYSWFITHQNSNTGTLSATQRAVAYSTSLIIYERVMQSSTWGAWVNRSTVNNLTTASAGNGVLDAYQGKVLNDKIINLKTYSTSEIDTGKIWIDGKHIYRKVIEFTETTKHDNTPFTKTLSLGATVDTIISTLGSFVDAGVGTYKIMLNTYSINGVSYSNCVYYNAGNIYIWFNGNAGNITGRIIVEYTKA